MLKYWKENGRRLAAVLGERPLKSLTIDHVIAYQNQRTDEGRAPKTINGELSVLRQVLRYARLWYRFQEDYRAQEHEAARRPGAHRRGPAGVVRGRAVSSGVDLRLCRLRARLLLRPARVRTSVARELRNAAW